MAAKKKRVESSKKQSAGVREALDEGVTECKRWLEEIRQAKEDFKSYWEKCDQIVRRYKGEELIVTGSDKGQNEPRRYNVLWSMVQTMQPLIYAKPPQPFNTRRFKDKDPAARDGSEIMRRMLQYDLEGDEMHDALVDARDDFILGSRGVMWAKYKPYMALRESSQKTYLSEAEEVPDDVEIRKDPIGEYFHAMYEAKVDEEVDWEHIHYRSFLHGRAAKWRHVPWVARMVPMTRDELIDRFGKEIAMQLPLTINCHKGARPEEKKDATDEERGIFSKAEVWEIWSKKDKIVRWICPDFSKDLLDKKDDFLELRDFFPCPRPAYGTKGNDSLVPTPDFVLWQDIAMELDEVTWRIKILTQALRVVGVYDKAAGETLKRVTSQTTDNDMIPVDNWVMFAEKGGLKGVVEFLPVENVAAVVDKLYAARTRLVQELYEITGISDIVRGASDPRETAKAQQVKANFAGKRISTRQNDFMRMAREALEIHTQIACSQYSENHIMSISSAEEFLVNQQTQQFDPIRFKDAIEVLRSAPVRRYRIKVDEKSLAMEDTQQDKQDRTEFVQGVSQLLTAAGGILERAPAAGPLLGELLLFAVRGFPAAKTTEAAIEQAVQQLMGQPMPQEPQEGSAGPQPPTPEEIQIEQQKVQIEMMKVQADNEYKKKELELRERELMLKEYEIQLQAKNREQETQLRAVKESTQAQVQFAQIENQKRQTDGKMQLDAYKVEADRTDKAEERQFNQALSAQQSEREYELNVRQQDNAERTSAAEMAFKKRTAA